MKKVFGIIALAAILFVSGISNEAFAQNGKKVQTKAQILKTTPNASGANFVDANGDGVCDNQGKKMGTNKNCTNFVDANNNGICDLKENGTCTGKQNQCKKGKGNGHGKKCCNMTPAPTIKK